MTKPTVADSVAEAQSAVEPVASSAAVDPTEPELKTPEKGDDAPVDVSKPEDKAGDKPQS